MLSLGALFHKNPATSPIGCKLKSAQTAGTSKKVPFCFTIVTQSWPLWHKSSCTVGKSQTTWARASPLTVAETQRISFLLAQGFKVSKIHRRNQVQLESDASLVPEAESRPPLVQEAFFRLPSSASNASISRGAVIVGSQCYVHAHQCIQSHYFVCFEGVE